MVPMAAFQQMALFVEQHDLGGRRTLINGDNSFHSGAILLQEVNNGLRDAFCIEPVMMENLRR